MATIIRRGQEADLPALRDILNHYILNTVVTFEMGGIVPRKPKDLVYSVSGRGALPIDGGGE